MKKVLIITGGNSNLGLEIVKKFESEKYIVYSPTHSELDVTSGIGCQKYIKKVVKSEGKIDVLVNCVGITPVGLSLDKTADDFLQALDINVVGAFRMIKEVINHMDKKNGGKIININSLNGLVSLPNYGIYSASKHALEAISFALRQELKDRNIYVTSILPGAIMNGKKTNLSQVRKSAREKFLILKYLMPFLTAGEVAESVLTIAKSDSPPARVILGNDAKITTFLMKILPFSLWDQLVYYIWNYK